MTATGKRRPYHPRGELVEGYMVQEHPLYTTHADMLNRCRSKSCPQYEHYGARGIGVCDRWLDFRNFVADMGAKPTDAHTLERTDNDKGYEPLNCVWATRTEQALNRRTFKTNTSGHRGVVEYGEGYHARFDYEKTRYDIGYFSNIVDAMMARDTFVELFFKDRDAAIASIQDKVRSNSSTRIRGVTPCEEGFIARCTIDGERHYIGYFKTIQGAADARRDFIASRTGKIAGRI